MFDILKKKYNELLNPVNQGLSQVSRSVPQPVKSFVKPIVNEVRNIATQQIPSYQRVVPLTQMTSNPIGFMNAAKQQVQNIQQNKPIQAAKNVGMDVFNSAKLGANVYGGSKILAGGAMNAAKTILPNAAIGGGINKLSGGSFSEGAGSGVALSPSLRGITAVTNPLIEKGVSRFVPRVNNQVANFVAPRITRGALNVPEGAVIDASLGRRPLSPESMALDFVSGSVLPGNPNAKLRVKGLKGVNPRAFKMHPEDIQTAKTVLDRLRGKMGTVQKEDKEYLMKTLNTLIDTYIPGYKNNKNQDVYKVLENLIYKNEGQGMDKLPIAMGLMAGQKATGYKDAPNKFSAIFDKKTRFEIDDSKSYMKKMPVEEDFVGILNEKRLKDYLEHDELYKNYPQLKNVPVVKLDSKNDGTLASWDGEKINIGTLEDYIQRKHYAPWKFMTWDKELKRYRIKKANVDFGELQRMKQEYHSTLIHELQHTVQQIEKFGSGGDPKAARQFIEGKLREATTLGEKDKWEKLSQLSDYELYKRLPGEFESRNTQARIKLSAEERATTLPYNSEKIPASEILPQQRERGFLNVAPTTRGYLTRTNGIDDFKITLESDREIYERVKRLAEKKGISPNDDAFYDFQDKYLEDVYRQLSHEYKIPKEFDGLLNKFGNESYDKLRWEAEKVYGSMDKLDKVLAKYDVNDIGTLQDIWKYKKQPLETQLMASIEKPNVAQQPLSDISQTKQYTQLGSATNTRADQIAPKLRKPAPFEVEMDAQVGKPYEKPFKGRSKLKLKEPTKLPGDQATADFATARAAMGGNGVKGLPKETSDQFQKWVNTRRATQLEGVLKKKEYADLNNKGIEGIFEFQSGNKTGRYGDVKKYFDTKYKTLQDNKIEFDFRQDYLPQLWNNTPEEINQVMGRRMGMKPSFTLDAVFKSYKEGIDAGLTPKFQNISDLVGWYEQKANKAIADKNFFDFLGKDGTILPSTKAPMDWVTLDPDRFPKFLTQIADEKFAGTYKAPKEVADVINGYLRDPQMPMLEKVANYVSGVKSIALNFGIPGTAINAHGMNILARHTLMGTGGNPISRLIKGTNFMFNQKASGAELDKVITRAPKAMKDGLMLSSDDYSNRIVEATNLRQKFGKKWEEVFGGPLFNKMIPALKISSYEELVKNGMNGKDAAKLVNNVYGGINWEQLGRSKDTQNLFRVMILAPDWAETTLRTGGNFVKALNPKDRSMVMNRYRTMMATILGSYVAHNVANKLTSGHYSFENEPSNIFNIQVGYTEDGEKRYIRPYGTGLDMVRLPAEVAMGLFKGDLTGVTRLLRNRLSIPAGVVVGALTDQDYRGNAIGWRGTDKFGNEMPMGQRAMNIGTEMASLVGLPSFIKQFGMSATGQQSLEAGLTQGFELPTRYQNPGKSKTQEYVGKVSELKGKDLYDLKTRFKGESPFSDNQKAVINQGGLPALEQVMQLREQKRQVNKSKDIQEQVVNGEITEEEGKRALEEILKTSAPVTQKKVDSTNKAYASDTVTGSFSEDIAKNRVKLTKKSERLGNKIIYPTEDGTGTIDLTPPTKGTGIGAYANKDWNITKARSIWNNDSLTQEDKDYAFKKLGVKPEDVRYDALANYDVDIKAQYLSSKSTTKERLIENIKTGRKRSVGDLVFASDGVIDAMVDEGRLTKEEAKELKAIDYDKSGKLKVKAAGKGRRGAKPGMPTVKPIKIYFSKGKKVKRVKPTTVRPVRQYKLVTRKNLKGLS